VIFTRKGPRIPGRSRERDLTSYHAGRASGRPKRIPSRHHAGLIPIMWSTGTAPKSMQLPFAVPYDRGMISSTSLTLVVSPRLSLIKGFGLPR